MWPVYICTKKSFAVARGFRVVRGSSSLQFLLLLLLLLHLFNYVISFTLIPLLKYRDLTYVFFNSLLFLHFIMKRVLSLLSGIHTKKTS